MINLKNSFLLAKTKLKIRKIRLIVSVVISSLMFSILIFGSLLYKGAVLDTLENFKSQGLSGRAIIKINPIDNKDFFETIKKDSLEHKQIKEIIDKKVIIAEKTAKRLGLPFTENDKENYYKKISPINDDQNKETDDIYLNDNFIKKDFLINNKYYKSHKLNQEKTLKLIAKKHKKQYNGYVFYSPEDNVFTKNNGKYNFIKDTKKEIKDKKSLFFEEKKPTEQSKITDYSVLPKEIYKSFELKNHNWKKNNKTIPIIVSSEFLRKKLNIKKLTKNSEKKEVLDYNKKIVTKAKNLKFKQCYFNEPALKMLENAKNYQKALKDDEKNKSKKDYVSEAKMFTKVYKIEDETKCELPALVTNKLSKEEQELEKKLDLFEQKTDPNYQKPQSFELEFEVIGVLPPNPDYSQLNDSGFINMITSILMQNHIANSIIPKDYLNKLDDKDKITNNFSIFNDNNENLKTKINNHQFEKISLIEFKNGKRAKDFKDKYTCNIFKNITSNNKKDQQEITDYFDKGILPKRCLPNKIFSYSSYGNKLLDLESFRNGIRSAMKWAIIVITVIATIIMTGTVGKLIGDSRKETAVFRAIGFKRFDILLVYLTYTVMVSIFTIISASVLALIGALLVSNSFNRSFTTEALYFFSATDFNLATTMIGYDLKVLGLIALTIICVGILSLIIPILSSIKRNPINDMRNE